MLKQENNYNNLIKQLKEKQIRIKKEYEDDKTNYKDEKKREKALIFQYESDEVKEEIELVEYNIKKMEYKEKVEKEYENLVRDSKE